jgi:hypothetical protein
MTSLRDVPEDSRTDLLLNADFDEMLWSVLLTAATLDDSEDLLADASRQLLAWLDTSKTVDDAYVRRFAAGLLVATGIPGHEVDRRILALTPADRWADSGDDFHIDPLGRANSCNLNRTKHWTSTPRAVNSWAAQHFPDFV